MKTLLLVISLSLIGFGGAAADPIADRQAIMKRIGGIVGRDLAAVARGDTPYDATAVLASLQALDAEAKAFDVATLFPLGSDAGDTKVSSKIWQDIAGFEKAVDAFREDIATALTAAPKDVASFTPLFTEIGTNCRSCHTDWRR